jgi:hypothetical protein
VSLGRAHDGCGGGGPRRQQGDEREGDSATASLGGGADRRSRESCLQLFAAPAKQLATQSRDDRRDVVGVGRRASLLESLPKPRCGGKTLVTPALESPARDGIQRFRDAGSN